MSKSNVTMFFTPADLLNFLPDNLLFWEENAAPVRLAWHSSSSEHPFKKCPFCSKLFLFFSLCEPAFASSNPQCLLLFSLSAVPTVCMLGSWQGPGAPERNLILKGPMDKIQ